MASVKYALSLPLVVALLICFTNAISQTAIDEICGMTADKGFCQKHIGTDPRALAAPDFKALLLLAVSQSQNQVIDGQHELEAIRGGVTDPAAKRQLSVCDWDYDKALSLFQRAADKTNQGAFGEVTELARDGTNAVIHCLNVYRGEVPNEKNPFQSFNLNVFNLYDVIAVIINKLSGYYY